MKSCSIAQQCMRSNACAMVRARRCRRSGPRYAAVHVPLRCTHCCAHAAAEYAPLQNTHCCMHCCGVRTTAIHTLLRSLHCGARAAVCAPQWCCCSGACSAADFKPQHCMHCSGACATAVHVPQWYVCRSRYVRRCSACAAAMRAPQQCVRVCVRSGVCVAMVHAL